MEELGQYIEDGNLKHGAVAFFITASTYIPLKTKFSMAVLEFRIYGRGQWEERATPF